MPKFKIVRSYIVEADDKTEALRRLTTAESIGEAFELLDYQSVPRELDEKGRTWGQAAREQITGK